MSKTYVPELRFVLEKAHKYGTRWQAKMAPNLTSAQAACLASTLAAIADCLILLGPNTINP